MGIRFLCHHCKRRLNVKATQTGTEGQCPHCMSTVTVPAQSTIPVTLEKKTPRPAGRFRRFINDLPGDVDADATIHGVPAELQSGGQESSDGIDDYNDSDSIVFEDNLGDNSAELFMLDKPTPPPSFGKVDPIAEAPERVWYFRSRKLGEKGPLNAKQMRERVDCGDVTVGCVVWREDWDDWAKAEAAFPSLAAKAKAQRRKARVAKALKESNYSIPQELDPASELNRRRRRKNRIFKVVIGVGLVLITVLVLVLMSLLDQ